MSQLNSRRRYKPGTSTRSRVIVEQRQLKGSDIIAVRAVLEQHVVDGLTGEPVEDEIEGILACMCNMPDEFGRKRKYFLAKQADNDLIVGLMSYANAQHEIAEHCKTLATESAELLNAFVCRTVQRIGVGQQLFQHVCEAASHEGKKWLLVVSGPRYSQSWGFYDAACDAFMGYMVNAYGDDVHAKTWRKSLS
ncbi:MAG: hypothetical protein HY711_10930 [Candidatus Melainabacteria bacterium]|nr:hypothetical protein [Candidatus Melainabacteria bacterium]